MRHGIRWWVAAALLAGWIVTSPGPVVIAAATATKSTTKSTTKPKTTTRKTTPRRTTRKRRTTTAKPKAAADTTGRAAATGDTVAIFPPETRVAEAVDTLFGVAVKDPYRWLEDDHSPEVRAWTDAQNGLTRVWLGGYKGRDALKTRATALLKIGSAGAPEERRGRLFYIKRTGDQNQPVLYVRDTPEAPARILVDPNLLARDGSVALDWWYPSPDGTLLAYGTSKNGDEWSTLRVRDVATGLDRPDQIPRTRHCSLAWRPDGAGFYYTRYPDIGDVPRGEETYHVKLWHHALGAAAGADSLVFGQGRPKENWYDVRVSPNGRWLAVMAGVGWTRTDLYLKALDGPGAPWQTLVEGQDNLYTVEMAGDSLYIQTNEGAPRYRMFLARAASPARAAWREIIPEGADALQGFKLAGGRLFLHYLHDAASLVRVAGLDGIIQRDLTFPVMGTVNGLGGEADGAAAWIAFDSCFVPPITWRCDPASGALTVFDKIEAPVDPAAFELKQLRYPSKDGTNISMFVMHRKGLTLDGKNPTLLYGYGGFDLPITPGFGRDVILWLEQGGVYAVANLRGGGEYGEEWHRAGMLGNKQNVFDDFTAAAQFLVRQKYTSASRLAIMGGSNGGLLVGAVMVQHPELCRAVVCQVPLLDMLRYHKFLLARLWIPEYGSAEDATQFQWLYNYSPYHRVVPGTPYPAVLLTTADSDSRVAPLHARKMAARLQAATTSGRPVLLRVETQAGHGAGTSLQKAIGEALDTWSFLFMELNVPPPGSPLPRPTPAAAVSTAPSGGAGAAKGSTATTTTTRKPGTAKKPAAARSTTKKAPVKTAPKKSAAPTKSKSDSTGAAPKKPR